MAEAGAATDPVLDYRFVPYYARPFTKVEIRLHDDLDADSLSAITNVDTLFDSRVIEAMTASDVVQVSEDEIEDDEDQEKDELQYRYLQRSRRLNQFVNACFRNTDFPRPHTKGSLLHLSFPSYQAARQDLVVRLALFVKREIHRLKERPPTEVNIPFDLRLQRASEDGGAGKIGVWYKDIDRTSGVSSVHMRMGQLFHQDGILMLDWGISLTDDLLSPQPSVLANFRYAIMDQAMWRKTWRIYTDTPTVDNVSELISDKAIKDIFAKSPTEGDRRLLLFTLLAVCYFVVTQPNQQETRLKLLLHQMIEYVFHGGYTMPHANVILNNDMYKYLVGASVLLNRDRAREILLSIRQKYEDDYLAKMPPLDPLEYPPCFEQFPFGDNIVWFGGGGRLLHPPPPQIHTLSLYGQFISQHEYDKVIEETDDYTEPIAVKVNDDKILIPFDLNEVVAVLDDAERFKHIFKKRLTNNLVLAGPGLDSRYPFRYMYIRTPSRASGYFEDQQQVAAFVADLLNNRTSLSQSLRSEIEAIQEQGLQQEEQNDHLRLMFSLYAFLGTMIVDMPPKEYMQRDRKALWSKVMSLLDKQVFVNISDDLAANPDRFWNMIDADFLDNNRLKKCIQLIQESFVVHVLGMSLDKWREIVEYRTDAFRRLLDPAHHDRTHVLASLPRSAPDKVKSLWDSTNGFRKLIEPLQKQIKEEEDSGDDHDAGQEEEVHFFCPYLNSFENYGGTTHTRMNIQRRNIQRRYGMIQDESDDDDNDPNSISL